MPKSKITKPVGAVKKTKKTLVGKTPKKVPSKPTKESQTAKKTPFGGGPKNLKKLPVGLANYWRRQRGEKEVAVKKKETTDGKGLGKSKV